MADEIPAPAIEDAVSGAAATLEADATPDSGGAAERVLNQEEIDSLLGFDVGADQAQDKSGVRAIINSALVSYERLPMLEIVFDRLVRLMTTSLRNFTSDNVEVSLDSITSIRFGDYLNSIPLPAILAVFHAEELDNYGLFTVDSNLIYSIVDVLLGGRRGSSAMRIEGRPYTTIERTLVQRMIEVIMQDMCAAFEPLAPVNFSLDRLETNPRFAAIARPANAAILVKLRIDMEDRIALLGQNGNGKSTFIRLISQRLEPREGRLKKTPKLRVGYFSQDQEEGLDFEATPFDHMARALGPGAGEAKVRAQLGRFGFSRDRANLKVGVMSGGEKTRLLLALATRTAPHMLLLDEPTNHLDMDARASLVDAINDFEGAVVLVSHDTHLVKMVADTLWVVQNGTVSPFDGDIDEYQTKLLKERGARPAKADKPVEAASKKDQRKAAADNRTNKAPLKKAVDSAEKMLARLTEQMNGVLTRLADPAIYTGPGSVVTDLQKEKARLEREVANAEKRWLAAQEALEAAA